MNLIARWAACASLVLGALVPVAGPATIACADEGPRAALVVDTGEAVHRLCVKLPDDRVSGLELIVLANEQHGLSYRFGHGGGAVCMLAGVGTSGDDCFGSYPDFWGYWRGSSSGSWTWSSTGAGSTSVGDADVEGWSWGSGNDGSSHPRPPATMFPSVCPVAAPSDRETPPSKPGTKEPAPAARPGPRPTPAPRAVDAPVAAEAATTDAPRRQRAGPRRSARVPAGKQGDESATGRSDPSSYIASEPVVAAKQGPSTDPGRPPVAGLVALGAAAFLGGAGFVLARRRRGSP